MKVLLFIQTGDARPKCKKSFGTNKARGLQYIGHLVRPESGRWLYWLVACTNAAHGRRVIEFERTHPEHLRVLPGEGRVLASGGRP